MTKPRVENELNLNNYRHACCGTEWKRDPAKCEQGGEKVGEEPLGLMMLLSWMSTQFILQVLYNMCLVAQSCRRFATPWTVARQAPLSMGILQARILEWVAMPSSRGSSQPRD